MGRVTFKTCNAATLMDHKWLRDTKNSQKISKNKSSQNLDEMDDLKLNLKELLNVSSGWKDNNNLRGEGGENGPINPEF